MRTGEAGDGKGRSGPSSESLRGQGQGRVLESSSGDKPWGTLKSVQETTQVQKTSWKLGELLTDSQSAPNDGNP